MMSKVGLELTNFINPDLTWKTVSKGYRSGTRRSRKQVTRNWKVGAKLVDKSGRMVEDAEATVSDSEKLGVDVLGRRFSDKIEHVPIKKRRFMIRSPSPPGRNYTTPLEESGQLVDNDHSNVQACPKYMSRKQLKSSGASSATKTTGTTDFSQLKILVDVACSRIGKDAVHAEGSLVEESKQEVNDSSTSGVPLEENVASSETTSFSEKDMIHEDKKDNTVAGLQNCSSEMDDGIVKKSVSLRDDRSHWDLNVSMDAWEQPCEIDSQINSVEGTPMEGRQGEKLQTSEWCETLKDVKHDTGSTGQLVIGGVVSSDASKDIHMFPDSKCSAPGTYRSSREDNKLESCSDLKSNNDGSIPASGDHGKKSSTEVVANAEASILVVSKDACSDQPPCFPSEGVTSLQLLEDGGINLCIGNIVKPRAEDDTQKPEYDASSLQLGDTSCVDKLVQVMKDDVALPCEPVPERVACETDNSILNDVGADSGKTLGLHDRSLQGRMSTGSCPPSPLPVGIEPVNKAEELYLNPSTKCEDMSTAGASVGEGLPGATLDNNSRHKDEASALHAAEVDSPNHYESAIVGAGCGASIHDACKKNGSGPASSSGKVSADDPSFGGYDSDVSQEGKGHIIGMEIIRQDGYDSQFEDGELRETDMCYWDNDNGEDGEAECVDYESDNGETCDHDAADYSATMSGKVEVGSECEKEGFCGSEAEIMEKKIKVDRGFNAVSDNVIENGRHSEDTLREPGGSDFANLTSEMIEEGTIKKYTADCVDGHDMKDIPVRAVGSKTSRRELQSCIEGHLSPDIRKDLLPALRNRSENFDDSYPRVEGMAGSDKSMGRDRSTLHVHDRSPGGGHLFNPSGSFRDSRRGHSPTYYGSYSSGRPRPKSVIESRGYVMASDNTISDAVGGLDGRVRRQFINSSSNGVYRPHGRRRSPSEREDAYGMPTGMVPVRDISPDRRRFRRYPQGVNRGIREEYHRQMPDETTEYSNRMPHHIVRRQRSISPFGRGPPHYTQPFKKSRSRSRSRSPVGWLLPRDRNEGPRHRSRSPDFRCKGRIERTRLPFQRPSFAAGYEGGFMSPPGSRFSPPPRNSRWFDDRNCGVDHLRGRRSPVRMFRPNQRFESGRPIRRLNSDDYFRPMVHPGRYNEMAGAGRGRKYENGEDDRRKTGERYEVIHRVRRYDSDGVVRRFRYDAEDCFVAKNSNSNYDDCNRSTDRRPRDVVPRRGSEEKDQPRLNQEQPRLNQIQEQPRLMNQEQPPRFNLDNKVNNTSPNAFGVQEETALT